MFRLCIGVLFVLLFYNNRLFSQEWKELGPCGSDLYGNHVASQGGTGQVHCITFDPDNTNIVYCGSPFGGLWKSKDGGKNWSCAGIDVNQGLDLSSVCDIAIAKGNNKKTIWVATGHPGARGGEELFSTGLYYSEDEGKTFQPSRSFNNHFYLKDQKHISRIIVHPKNPNILFVATSDGLYQTTNGGKSWKLVLTEDELPGSNEYSNGIFSVEFSKTNPNKVIYASGKDVYRSTKGGKKGSFKSMSHNGADFFGDGADCFQNLNFNIDVNNNSTNTDLLYALGYVKGDTCVEFKGRSSSVLFFYNGKNWERRKSVPGSIYADPIRLKIASVPGDPSIVYVGTVTTSVSSDSGKTWREATNYNQPGHADIHAVEIIPGTKDMMTGTDGGVFRYNYQTNKVEEYNNGLCITTVIDMGTSASNPKKIIIGNQDTGSDMWDGENWTKLPSGGDGYPGQLINSANEFNFFTCANFQFMENESKKGFNLKSCSTCQDPRSACPYIFLQSPHEPNVFYYSGKELYKSEDNCKTWCRISDFRKTEGLYFNPEGHIISAIQIAPSDSDVIYVAYNDNPHCCNSFLFKTTKGGMECTGNCSDPKGTNNWKYLGNTPRIEMGNPNENFVVNSYHYISGIAINDKNPDKVWTCFNSTKKGPIDFKVYKSSDGGNSWLADEVGLPEFPCTKILYVNGSNDDLFVGTFNGVYYKHGGEAWKRFGTNLPKVYVSDMEINYKARKLRVATYGRGVWEIDLP